MAALLVPKSSVLPQRTVVLKCVDAQMPSQFLPVGLPRKMKNAATIRGTT
jgi:hypothetical protein